MRVVAPEPEAVRPALAAALDGGEPILVSDDPAVIDDASVSEPTEAAVLLASSGSTGRPKIVELSAAALLASAHATHEFLGGPGVWTLQLPLHFVAGLQVVVRDLVGGAGRRYTSVVPTQLRRQLDTGALAGFDAVLVGGAACPPGLLQEARDRGINAVTTYGMTETCGGCVYDGRPLPGVGWRIEETIVLTGPTVALGYRGGARFHGEFRTADLGTVGPDGSLVVLGRADDVINSGGVKIHPQLVEAVLARQPGVRECVVAGVPDPEWGEAVVAWIVGPGDPDQVRAAVRDELGVATPKVIHRVATIPMLPSGKPDRARLRD